MQELTLSYVSIIPTRLLLLRLWCRSLISLRCPTILLRHELLGLRADGLIVVRCVRVCTARPRGKKGCWQAGRSIGPCQVIRILLLLVCSVQLENFSLDFIIFLVVSLSYQTECVFRIREEGVGWVHDRGSRLFIWSQLLLVS